ncbi:MAG: helix-turn-helix domain-containing protein [Armatimonadota bacterium]
MTLGQMLQRARLQAHADDPEVFAGRLGVPVTTLIAWEADLQRPTPQQLRRFAALAEVDVEALLRADAEHSPQGICRAVDLLPDDREREVLEQVGIPSSLWQNSEKWLAFLRLAGAATELDAEDITALADHAESYLGRRNHNRT